MKKTSLLVLLILTIAQFALAQNPPVPAGQVVKWTFASKKTADKTYEITMTAIVQGQWHIYSQRTPDGGPLPTKITYNKNPLVITDGKAKESGKLISKHEEVFGVDVIYFEGKASFVQTVKLKGNAKTSFSGKIEFMACNDEQCLPPTEVQFSVALQ